MNALKLYFRYIGISICGQLQYRVSFVLQSAGIFLTTGVEFIGVWALFHRFGQLRGWSLAEVAVFYGTVSIAFSIADALSRGFDQFGNLVKVGDFDRLLVRPRTTVVQLMGQEFTLRRFGRFVQGLLVLAWGLHAAHFVWTLPAACLFLFVVVSGVCLFTGLVVLQAASAYWTTEALEVWNAFTYGRVFMSQYRLGFDHGRARGFNAGFEGHLAASWALSVDGLRAYELWKAGDLEHLTACDRPGWKLESGVCFPRADEGKLYGWHVR